ncbi:Rieske (2Fe-2S) protein [Nesterenkonia lutea]|uniref:Cytochrome bc1 complex Rieske iron-sulfur subunit n=1 Tax=Nesterenkonia lutea TaxID=272919 RepID=A0ABR9JCY5_9MICC|nr:Rieske (2Fe-2S) protein [Nesterenkonia lutea]MBE1523794.1 nitrite reductase/ring-hydroxylating ferredoxin subunit [Nesterenkonia lutea]
MSRTCWARRRFLHAAALSTAAGAGAVALSGCGSTGSEEADPSPPPDAPWTEVMPSAELPVGSSRAVSVGETELLLHRSSETEVHAFSAVCTHQGCAVAAEEGRFACPCHGSMFNLETGAVEAGPAEDPLPRRPAEISADAVRVQA